MIDKKLIEIIIQATGEFEDKVEDRLSLASYGFDSDDLIVLIEALEELINDDLNQDNLSSHLDNEPLFERPLEEITIAEIIELVQRITK